MIAAILQPYFFPYIGYFQLMQAVDVFVAFDDVQYIQRGWVNRNRILINNNVHWITLPVTKASRANFINQRHYASTSDGKKLIKRQLDNAYRSSPYKNEVLPIISELIDFLDSNVATYNTHLLASIANALGIRCDIKFSSTLQIAHELKGQDRVIAICQQLAATTYINPIGGVDLYDPAAFSDAGITLSFLKTITPPTPTNSGWHHLSVIDGLMQNGFESYRNMLSEYMLLAKEEALAAV